MARKKALVAKELNTKQDKLLKQRREAMAHARAVKAEKDRLNREAVNNLAADLKLSPKTKAFVDLLNEDPTISKRQAYIKTHETNNVNTAAVQANRLLKQPNVMIYSQQAVNKARNKIVTLVDSKREDIALKASESVLDRQFGKATQKQERTQRTVEVKLDLTGVRIGTHYLQRADD